MADNKDLIVVSAEDLSALTDYNFKSLESSITTSFTDSPILAGIYGANTKKTLNVEAWFYNSSIESKYPSIYKMGKMFASSNGGSGFKVSDNAALTSWQNVGTNYNATLFIFEDYCCQCLSADHEALSVDRFDKDTTSLSTFAASYSNESRITDYWISVFGVAPGFMWEKSFNTEKYLVAIGNNSSTSKKCYISTVADFKSDYTDISIWKEIDINALAAIDSDFNNINFSTTNYYATITDAGYLFIRTSTRHNFLININDPLNDFVKFYDTSIDLSNTRFCVSYSKKDAGLSYFILNTPDGAKIYDITNGIFDLISDGDYGSVLYYSKDLAIYMDNLSQSFYGNYNKFDAGGERGLISSLSTYNGTFTGADTSTMSYYGKQNAYTVFDSTNIFFLQTERVHATSILEDPNLFVIKEEPTGNRQHQRWLDLK